MCVWWKIISLENKVLGTRGLGKKVWLVLKVQSANRTREAEMRHAHLSGGTVFMKQGSKENKVNCEREILF